MPGLQEWLSHAEWLRLELLGRLLLAAVLGGIIGIERELSGKPAGFRTNLLICVGAALFTDLSVRIVRESQLLYHVGDPARVAAQIVSGIGFLGAGTIIQSRGSVTGLTTAATLWVVSAIGTAVGAAAYMEAVGTTALVMVALLILGRVERHFLRTRPHGGTFRFAGIGRPELVGQVERLLVAHGFSVSGVEVQKTPEGIAANFEAVATERGWEAVLAEVLRLPGVVSAARE